MDVLSVVVDGEEKNEIPERGPHRVEVNCGETKGEWDYNAWTLNLANLKENTRCNVTFTSNALNEREYQQYLEAGKTLRRNTYRGKVLSGTLKETIKEKEVTTVGEYTLDQVYAMINDGTFSDIYVGDVIVSNEITWLVADIDNYLYSGDTPLTKHHLTIIPATPLTNSGMNSTSTTGVTTTEGKSGYLGSEILTGNIQDTTIVKTSLPKLLEEKIEPAFRGHIIEFGALLPKEVNMDVASSGYSDLKGASYDWTWVSGKLDLMTEMNVYGAHVWSSSGYEIGVDNRQYAIFQLRRK